MANVFPHADFWRGRRVFLTGHTGFVGGWTAFWLQRLGAKVTGYALPPPTRPSFFAATALQSRLHHIEGDVRDLPSLDMAMRQAEPEILLHLAAQPIVREAYRHPVDSFAINTMGTVHALEAARACSGLKAVVVFTTDKVYRNHETGQAYREQDELGGDEPYSASKSAAELVAEAYRNRYLATCGFATVRAGNIIGGGDWASDRLVPDAIRAFSAGRPLEIRRPDAVRPWQHVLEAARGLLLLAERLVTDPADFSGPWNFGPPEDCAASVRVVCDLLAGAWGSGARWIATGGDGIPEAGLLSLNSDKAAQRLQWRNVHSLPDAVARSVEWYRAAIEGKPMEKTTERQIAAFSEMAAP